jgi:hypothetical protein
MDVGRLFGERCMMWRTKKDALLLFVLFCFYSAFVINEFYYQNSLDIPNWVHYACPLLIGFMGLNFFQARQQWKDWVQVMDVYQLTLDKKVGFWGLGTIRFTGTHFSRDFVIELEELDVESEHRDYCQIRLHLSRPKRKKVIQLRSLDKLKEELDSSYGLQRPLLDNDLANLGEAWKQRTFPTAIEDLDIHNRNKKSRIEWTKDHFLIVIEEKEPLAKNIANVIAFLHQITEECRD